MHKETGGKLDAKTGGFWELVGLGFWLCIPACAGSPRAPVSLAAQIGKISKSPLGEELRLVENASRYHGTEQHAIIKSLRDCVVNFTNPAELRRAALLALGNLDKQTQQAVVAELLAGEGDDWNWRWTGVLDFRFRALLALADAPPGDDSAFVRAISPSLRLDPISSDLEWALAKFEDSAANILVSRYGSDVTPLLAMLRSEDADSRAASVVALGEFKGQRETIVPALLAVSKDPSNDFLLPDLGVTLVLLDAGAAAVPILGQALRHPSWKKRLVAVQTLGRLGRPAAEVRESVARMAAEDSVLAVREAAECALARIDK